MSQPISFLSLTPDLETVETSPKIIRARPRSLLFFDPETSQPELPFNNFSILSTSDNGLEELQTTNKTTLFYKLNLAQNESKNSPIKRKSSEYQTTNIKRIPTIHNNDCPIKEKISSFIKNKSITYNENEYKLCFISNKCGQHTQLCALIDSPPLIPEKDNSNLFVKIFHNACLNGFGKYIPNLISTSMKQREEILIYNESVPEHRKLNIVNVLNAKTIHTDLFYIVEKLDPFTTPWDKSSVISNFTIEQLSILNQIGVFLDYALNSPSKISLDLKSDNFAIDSNKKLTLIDFMEHEEDSEFAFHFRAKTCMISLSFNNKSVLSHYLKNHLNKDHLSDLYERIKDDLMKENMIDA